MSTETCPPCPPAVIDSIRPWSASRVRRNSQIRTGSLVSKSSFSPAAYAAPPSAGEASCSLARPRRRLKELEVVLSICSRTCSSSSVCLENCLTTSSGIFGKDVPLGREGDNIHMNTKQWEDGAFTRSSGKTVACPAVPRLRASA
ncbi:uncharacterized protein [Lolium perenne]|uniref:uncharacterized protein n=1 Tax=Lolium perenne TaxID=4522 RepID=UPI003A9A2FE1